MDNTLDLVSVGIIASILALTFEIISITMFKVFMYILFGIIMLWLVIPYIDFYKETWMSRINKLLKRGT